MSPHSEREVIAILQCVLRNGSISSEALRQHLSNIELARVEKAVHSLQNLDQDIVSEVGHYLLLYLPSSAQQVQSSKQL